jgi:hypothetical protein
VLKSRSIKERMLRYKYSGRMRAGSNKLGGLKSFCPAWRPVSPDSDSTDWDPWGLTGSGTSNPTSGQ